LFGFFFGLFLKGILLMFIWFFFSFLCPFFRLLLNLLVVVRLN
jgi:hypothetical protein